MTQVAHNLLYTTIPHNVCFEYRELIACALTSDVDFLWLFRPILVFELDLCSLYHVQRRVAVRRHASG